MGRRKAAVEATAVVQEAAPERKPSRKHPDFSGVAGEFVTATDPGVALLHWGNQRRISPYDALLEDLARRTEAARVAIGTPEPVLRFCNARARTSLGVRARKLGLIVEFALSGTLLYVRHKARVSDKAREERRGAILRHIKLGPMNAIALAGRLRQDGDNTVNAGDVEVILEQLTKTGAVVRQESGDYRLPPAGSVRAAVIGMRQ